MTQDTGSPSQQHGHFDDEISVWEVLAVLIRRRRTIVLTPIVLGLLVVVIGLLMPRQFTSSATFRPQGSEVQQSQLLSLANQFGVSVPGIGSEEASPQFYAELIGSRAILGRLVGERFDVEGVGLTTLADLLEIEEETEALREEEVLLWFVEESVSGGVATETGTVSLAVTTEWPDLSFAIVQRIVEEVQHFNLDTRSSQAAEERRFIAARSDSAGAELRAAEADLQDFLESNRIITGVPLLELERDRLQREVTRHNSLYTALLQSLDQASIQEVRDTPMITVIQEPFLPPGPDRRGLTLRTLIALILGGFIGLGLAFAREATSRPSDSDPFKKDFDDSWASFMASIPLVGRRYR